jgi:hypothetical protein
MPVLSKLLVRLGVAISVLGSLAAVATSVIAWRTMQNFSDDARQVVLATNDPQRIASFEATVQTNHQLMILLAGLCLLTVALSIGAAVLLLRARLN